MTLISFTALLNFMAILFLTGLALDFLGISKLLNNLSLLISTNKDAAQIVANNYFLIFMVIFPLSYISFVYVIKWLSNTKYLEDIIAFYNKEKKLSTAYFTVVLVFFGFLPVFLNILALKPTEFQELNNIFLLITLSSIFPYFNLLISEAKEKTVDSSVNNNIYIEKKKPIRRDNIYFLLAIIFLVFIFVLIYYIFQEKFYLSEEASIDLKTILLILGTVFGAYFGAKVAGSYAIQSVEKQLSSQSEKERQKEKRVLLKGLQVYSARSAGIIGFLNSISKVVDKPQGFDFFFKDYDTFEGIKKYLRNEAENLEKFNVEDVHSEDYFVFLLIRESLNQLFTPLEFMVEAMKKDDESLYHAHKIDFFRRIENFKKDILVLEEAKRKHIS